MNSVRAYSTRIPRPRLPQRPPVRTNDPLAAAEVAPLPGNVTFIHRPPPTQPSPFSLTTAPASALLRPPTHARPASVAATAGLNAPAPADGTPADASTPSLPPTTRTDKPPTEAWASQATIQQIRHLRTAQPSTFTRTALAKLYGVTPGFVGMVAPSKQPYRKAAHRAMDAEHAAQRETWGARKAMSVEVRRKRREFW
jgi:hypothetical protein